MRIGHAGLVTDGKNNRVLQATEYGALSKIGYVTDFTNRINFMVLRPKASSEIKSQVIQYAKEHLIGLPYNVFVGANYKQNEIKESQCAHIVWFAYHKFGYELLDKKRRSFCRTILQTRIKSNSFRFSVLTLIVYGIKLCFKK